jgi:hypothetical protein
MGGIVGAAAYQWLIYPFLPARQRALQLPMPEKVTADSTH